MSDEKKQETTFMEVLKELRTKTKDELTAEELDFMKARRSYLTVDERKYFGLEEQAPVEAEESTEEETPKKKK